MGKFCLLAVFAHPDDETIVGPLLAKYAHEGHAVHLLTLTAGEKGIRDHARIPAGEALRKVRTQEIACAAAKLGLTGHSVLNFPDQGFGPGQSGQIWNEAVSEVREAINRLQADVLITWGPEGGTGHPDHRGANSVVVQAFQQRSLLTHKPQKLYYAVFADTGNPGLDNWAPNTRVSQEFITTEIDCSRYTGDAQKAVECYQSQWTQELMQKIQRICQLENGRVLLRLAYSVVPWTGAAETDIFAGL